MKPIVIIGAGIAGLQAANVLHEAGIPFVLLEKQAHVGGRVQSEHFQGFTLDHGFQVLQTSYPEVQQSLRLPDLDLSYFDSGAYLWKENAWHPFFSPWHDTFSLLRAVADGIITIPDLVKLARLWLKIQLDAKPLSKSPLSAMEYIHSLHFSPIFRDGFLKPFFYGIFLDDTLSQPASLFVFYLKQFLEGRAAIPKAGMGAISDQLLSALPAESVRLSIEVESLQEGKVVLKNGEEIACSKIILAANPTAAADLLDIPLAKGAILQSKTFYFSADTFPNDGKLLHLVPKSDESNILHYACLSKVNPNLAPAGKELISVTTLKTDMTEKEVLQELKQYVGQEKLNWKFLKAYSIPESLSKQGFWKFIKQKAHKKGIILTGDYTQYPSLQAAFASGRMAAEAAIS
ncbi:NAD(P)/FAD-dependent oxidoreductase [Aquirufa aurantiipilula]|uniref:NAD(P)/FAD-dependent oxidoreductase n=1 Tax=Aquirufa aurantiipilula TaxID=2696561 RepID=A0ABT6BGF7_9BACT|nr:NAD(P)/FAD-dependent oxidoreductase [Aquirufa aurantiipilula]MDF5689344.1 NAD(P)/FAD-dependent oxidoreductase [Aquirufa aurantiipilula]